MYCLVHTHSKLGIAHALNYAIYNFYVSPQYQTYSQSKERYCNLCKPKKKKNKKIKKKTRHKIKYFYLFEIFQ